MNPTNGGAGRRLPSPAPHWPRRSRSPGQAHAAYTATVTNGTLQVVGDNASDNLVLVLSDPNTLALDVGARRHDRLRVPDRESFTAVNVDAGGGDDTVTLSTQRRPVRGDADHRRRRQRQRHADRRRRQRRRSTGGAGNDFIDGNIGADTELGGAGNDTFQWDPGDGSDVLDGEAGTDTLQFNGSNAGEKFDLAANGSHVNLHRDVAAITQDIGTASRRLNFKRARHAPTASTSATSRGTDVKAVDVDLDALRRHTRRRGRHGQRRSAAGPDKVSAGCPVPGRSSCRARRRRSHVSGGELARRHPVVTRAATTRSPPTSAYRRVVGFDGGDGSDTAALQRHAPATTRSGSPTTARSRARSPTGAHGWTTSDGENLDVFGLGGNDTHRRPERHRHADAS